MSEKNQPKKPTTYGEFETLAKRLTAVPKKELDRECALYNQNKSKANKK